MEHGGVVLGAPVKNDAGRSRFHLNRPSDADAHFGITEIACAEAFGKL